MCHIKKAVRDTLKAAAMQTALVHCSLGCKQLQTNPVQGSKPAVACQRTAAWNQSRRGSVRVSAVQRAHSPPRPAVERLSVPDAAPAATPHPDALRRRREAEERYKSNKAVVQEQRCSCAMRQTVFHAGSKAGNGIQRHQLQARAGELTGLQICLECIKSHVSLQC